MPSNYTPTPTDVDVFTVFTDGEQADAATFNRPIKQLADKVQWLDDEKLQAIERPESNVPVIASVHGAHDHPGSASNKWKLVVEQFVAGYASWVRLYVGDGAAAPGGLWALTHNAVWDPASGAQHWSKDDNTKISLALVCEITGLKLYQRAIGAGSWTTWTAGTGDLSIGGNASVGNDAAVGGDLTVANDAGVGGNLAVTGTAGAVAGFSSGGEYAYGPVKLRTSVIPLASVMGDPVFSGGLILNQGLLPNGGSHLSWPLKFPVGATLGNLQILVDPNTAGAVTATVYRGSGADWVSPAAPSQSTEGSDSSSGTGIQVLEIDLTGLTVGADDDMIVEISFSDAGDRVHALRMVDWQDISAARY